VPGDRIAWSQQVAGPVERQAEPGDQERDGQDDADVEQVDEAVERVSGGVFDAAVATESGAAGHR
jgi:hypothetical protein